MDGFYWLEGWVVAQGATDCWVDWLFLYTLAPNVQCRFFVLRHGAGSCEDLGMLFIGSKRDGRGGAGGC
jgi:hypothetical protein